MMVPLPGISALEGKRRWSASRIERGLHLGMWVRLVGRPPSRPESLELAASHEIVDDGTKAIGPVGLEPVVVLADHVVERREPRLYGRLDGTGDGPLDARGLDRERRTHRRQWSDGEILRRTV